MTRYRTGADCLALSPTGTHRPNPSGTRAQAPAACAILDIGSVSEPQRSSGLWIATAAGSTAAIRAAGGRILPLRSRKLQYLVREPYHGDRCRYRLRKGIIGPETPLAVTSKTRRGRLFLDGPHLRFSLGLGDVLTVTTAATPLRVLGLDGNRRRRF